MSTNSETTPLISPKSSSTSNNSASINSSDNIVKAFAGLLNVVEGILDWSPFIAVTSISGNDYPPVTAFFGGTLAAAFVLFYWFLKFKYLSNTSPEWAGRKYKPKSLDLGQFLLFGFLFVFSYLVQISLSPEKQQNIEDLLILWFNPLTTAGIGIIMWISVVCVRPFVFDYAEAQMPAEIWTRLSSKKWFRDQLTVAAMFWVNLLAVMTLVVTIQPILVTIFYDGDPMNDASGFMSALGLWLTSCQLLILFYGFYENAKSQGRSAAIKKRVCEVKDHGLTKEEKRLYDNLVIDDVDYMKNNNMKCLKKDDELDLAAEVLADAFESDDQIHRYVHTKEAKVSFFSGVIKSVSCFDKVLASYEGSTFHSSSTQKPSCVMCCIPVLSKSHEELEVFNTYESWKEHGFIVPGATTSNFPLPDDDLIWMGEMKKKAKHGLMRKSFLCIAWFGANPQYKGKGYGRVLLKYIIKLSETHKLPLVLETGTHSNRANYEKYGFKVVDHVEGYPHLVLMIRPVGESGCVEV